MSDIGAVTYETAVAVTKSDTTTDPGGPYAALIATATGTVKFSTIRGDVITLSTVAVGQIIPIAVSRVWSTGTSATVLGCFALPYKVQINPGTGTVL